MMEFIQDYIMTLQVTMDQLPRQNIGEAIDLLQQARLSLNSLSFCL
jgi:DNA-binding MurR/RpiR family transcriptional regulator